MVIMLEVLSDRDLHRRASEGYKKVGQSIDLHGKEDALVCREAGTLWNEQTTDGYPNMRAKIDAELAAVAEEFASGGLTWCERDVFRLISPYPANKKVDAVLENLGEDFFHDEIHRMDVGGPSAVAAGETEALEDSHVSSSSEDDSNDEREDFSTAWRTSHEEPAEEATPSDSGAAAQVRQTTDTINAIEAHLEGLRSIGLTKGVQVLEDQLAKYRRRLRNIMADKPAVLDTFYQQRKAEAERRLECERICDERKERQREAQKAIADRDAAVADLKIKRQKIQELESLGACKHAVKTFTPEDLGKGSDNAGGPKARKNRFEVLDRLARIKAGLSAGQKNDWPWFKDAWDKDMVKQHGADWAKVFSQWIQGVLDDERSNAFSIFVYSETCRVFKGTAALQVPGG